MFADRLVDLNVHHAPHGGGDRIALGFVKFLRFFADTFFGRCYGHRAVVPTRSPATPARVMSIRWTCLRPLNVVPHRAGNARISTSKMRSPRPLGGEGDVLRTWERGFHRA
jgi:hypothetical protein